MVGPKNMNEGWHNDDYLILFTGPESSEMTEGYGVQRYLPGFAVAGGSHPLLLLGEPGTEQDGSEGFPSGTAWLHRIADPTPDRSDIVTWLLTDDRPSAAVK